MEQNNTPKALRALGWIIGIGGSLSSLAGFFATMLTKVPSISEYGVEWHSVFNPLSFFALTGIIPSLAMMFLCLAVADIHLSVLPAGAPASNGEGTDSDEEPKLSAGGIVIMVVLGLCVLAGLIIGILQAAGVKI